MKDKEKWIIKTAIFNAMDFLAPPISRAQEEIAGYGYEWTEEHDEYAIKCLDEY